MSEHMNRSVGAAREAADAVRTLNHAGFDGDAWQWPSQVYDTIGALEHLAQMLPQAFEQAAKWLGDAYADGRVGHDRGVAHTEDGVFDAVGGLHDAAYHATSMAQALTDAHRHAAHLTGILPAVVETGEPR